jgi:hypothetical protein
LLPIPGNSEYHIPIKFDALVPKEFLFWDFVHGILHNKIDLGKLKKSMEGIIGAGKNMQSRQTRKRKRLLKTIRIAQD